MKITLEKYKLLKLSLSFYFLLLLCFYVVINNLWNFRRFAYYSNNVETFHDINYIKFTIATILITCSIVFLNYIKVKDFLYVILSLFLILFLIPSSIIFSVDSHIDWRIFFSHILLFYSVLFFSYIKIEIPLKEFSERKSFFLLFVVIVLGLLPFIRFIPYIDISNLWLENIYETRSVFAKIKDPYFGYTYGWFNRFLIPALLVFAIYFNNKKVVVFSFLLLVYLYLLGAHKSILYSTVFVIITYKFSFITVIKFIYKVIIFAIIVSIILAVFYDNNLIAIFTVRRALFMPALLDIAYFDLFDNNFQYWSEGVLKGITEYKYDKAHTYVISEKYFKTPKMASNNGIISDGFMNAGMIGVLINIFIISIYFSILNRLNINSRFFGLFIFLFVSLISSSLSTILLTHGALVLLVIAIIFLKNTEYSLK